MNALKQVNPVADPEVFSRVRFVKYTFSFEELNEILKNSGGNV